jgi:hypothetical protein
MTVPILTNAFQETHNFSPDQKNVLKMRKLLEKFPKLLLKETFFTVSEAENKLKHTCESIHNLAYDDMPFKTPLLISAFMIVLDRPIDVYILKTKSLDIIAQSKSGQDEKIEKDPFNSRIIEFLFESRKSKEVTEAFLIGEYNKMSEKRIGVMDLKLFKKNRKVKLLENIHLTKTNWGSFAFIKRKTVNETMRDNQVLILKYKLINLLSASFGFSQLDEVCPQVAKAAATLQYSLDISNSLKDISGISSRVEIPLEKKEKDEEEEEKDEDEEKKDIGSSHVTPQKGLKGSSPSSLTPVTKNMPRRKKIPPGSVSKLRGSIDTLLSFKH